MSSQNFSTFTEVGMIDARSQNGIITLPLTTDIPYRILTLKDIYGASAASSITLTTQGSDVFEDGTTSRLLNGAFETTTLYAGQPGFWYTTGGSRLATAVVGSLSTGLITNPLRLGTLSTQTSIQFPGVNTSYKGTVIAGQTTGAGTQELLLYQASTVSDQIRLQTTGNIVFEAGAAVRSFPSTQALATPTLYIAGTTSNVGIGTAAPAATLDVVGTGRFQILSSLGLNVSSINGAVPWQQSFLTSTTQGLGLIGYISSTQLTSTVAGLNIVAANAFTGSTTLLSAGTINVSTLNSVYLSSVQGYVSSLRTDSLTVGGPTGYVTVQDLTTGTVSTGQLVAGAGFISSLQINSLSFGPTGYVIVGNFIASSLSTMKLNTQNLYTNNAYIGNVSSQSAILFPGVDGNFRGTAVAEQGTGPGTGELLLYKVSTTTDQIRLQTTGNIVFEAGASARSWPSTQTLATPTLYIQGTTSNIGVGTATPATTLDVVGTVRGQVLSTLTLNTSTINGIVPGAAFNGSTLALSTGSITTNALQAYSYINMTGGAFSNVATSFFTTPKYTTTFTPTSISGLKVWLDASKITSITSNGSGQVLSLSNLTGLGNATQGTPSSAPLTGQYTFNNLNVLSNSFNTQLVLPSINYTSQYRTAFLVLQAPHYSAWIGANRSTDSIGMWSYGDLEIETAGTWIALTSFPSNAQNIPIIIDIHSSAASNGVYMNGSNLGSLLRTFATGSFTDTIGLGGTGTPLGGYYGGSWYFGEFIYYDAELTVSQRQTVEGYLAWKWGTQGLLAPTHPSYSAPPPPLGTVYLAAGSVGTDATSNLAIQATATTKISLAGNTQITGVLTTSSIGVSSITGTYASLSSVQISSINGLAVPTAFVGSTNFISASLVQAPLLSTFALNVSSINGAAPWQQSFLTSTTQGLGTTGYISSASLQSTVQGLGTLGYISSASLQSTVQGLGTLGYISSASLQSTFRGLGTAGYISSSQLTSTLAGLGTFGYISTQSLQSTVAGLNIVATNAFTGSTTSLSAGTIFVSSLNVNTINVSTIYITDTSLVSTSGSITQQNQILYFNTMPFAGTQAWFGQMIIPPGPPLISVFSYTGASQTWTVPTNVNSVNAYMWGAGGGGGGTIVGGAGAFVQAAVPVTPGETLTLIVGGGGARNSASAFGGGGVGGGGGFGTGGGGRTAIQRGSSDYVVVGAGGGSTSYGTAGIGGAGGILTGSAAVGTTGLEGQGGTQSAGGAGTSGVLSAGASGTAGAGGTAGGYGGGGGSGYYGGGGSGATTAVGASGGGGSSLVNNSVPILLVVSSDGTSAPNTGSQYYVSPVAAGGTNAASGNGGNGLIVLSYTAAPPAAASGLTLTLNGTTATLSWNSAGVPLYYWAFYGNSTSAYTGTYLMSGSTAGTSVSYSISATFFDYFRLVSLSPLGCISAIVSSPIVQVPAPSGLTLTASGTTVTMNWSAVANATSYTYTLFSNSSYAYSGASVATGSVGTNTATYSSGVVGTYYYFTVNATTSYGTSLSTTSGIVQGVPSFTATTFTYTGSNQSYTVPSNATILNVYMWGAGGGGGSLSRGGAGAYLTGLLTVTPSETLTIIVGQGGRGISQANANSGTISAYGGGGAVLTNGNGNSYGNGGGGGRSAIQRSSTDVVTVGAGGGTGLSSGPGYTNYSGGAGSYNGTGGDAGIPASGFYGKGGSTTAGGAPGGTNSSTAGSLNQGGSGDAWGGGGGSGYYGGGGGSDNGNFGSGGGGGGSSFTTNLTNVGGENSTNGYSAPGTAVTYYQSGVAVGAYTGNVSVATAGGNGLVVVLPVSLASPTGLALTPAVGNTATLSWTASTGATGYSWIVYQSSTNGYFGTTFATGSTNSTTYSATVSGLNMASYYYFTVIATGTPNSAAAVSAIMYELPDEPTPTCTTSGITVNMSWTAITGALYYTYTVYQASAYAYSGIQVATANNGNSLSATYTGVATNYYYFTVSVTTNAGTSALGTSGIAQAVALVAPTITTFSATGSDQLYTFPSSAALTVYMWAAAGGGTNSINGNFAGGAGAYVQGTLVATGAQYTIIVGKGGAVDGAAITTRAYKNGGAALQNDKAYIEGGGGGRSGLQLAGVNLIAVGAGGGAGGNGNGGAGGITSGANGSGPSTNYGLGGTQSAGGAAGTGTYNTASPGTQFGGGNAPTNGVGGGGGDGYYGGGGGVALGADQKGGGGGGGSSLTSNLSSLVTYVSSNGYSAPNTSSPYYQAGIAAGAPYATGGDGLVVISASTNTASPTNPTLVSSGGSATMSWTASAGATGYSWVLYQSATNAYTGSSFATGTTTSATTATTTGLNINSYYYFTVSATGTSNTSAAVASAIIYMYFYSISYLIVAGGGGGGNGGINPGGGGGGGGGLLTGSAFINVGNTYSVVVGNGGTAAATPVNYGGNGSNSTALGLTAIGGGGGAAGNGNIGNTGGSGGGSSFWDYNGTLAGGSGTPGQGNAGGSVTSTGGNRAGAGGGGAGGAAFSYNNSTNVAPTGGIGFASAITGTITYYAGGGGGQANGGYVGSAAGGLGGGGVGGYGATVSGNGTPNTGGGGGGRGSDSGNVSQSGAGGSGVIIFSVPTANYTGITTGSPTITTSGANTIIKFTASGSYTG